jgi:cytochrome c oxidase subunit II
MMLTAALFACTTLTPIADAADLAKGKSVYGTYCLACHQADGTGMGGALAADFVKDKTRLAKTDDQLLASIADGVPGTSMVAWGAMIPEEERKAVLAYIRATYGQ